MSDGGLATPPWAQPLWSIPPYGIRAEDVMPLKVRFLRKGRHSPESEGPERGGIDCLCRNRVKGTRETLEESAIERLWRLVLLRRNRPVFSTRETRLEPF